MRIADILSTKGSGVVHIAPDAAVHALVALLREHNLGAVVVSSDGRTIAGIVSERDVVRRLAEGADVLEQPVSALMSTDVHRGTPQDSVRSVMATMTGRRIRHVPVVDEQDRLARPHDLVLQRRPVRAGPLLQLRRGHPFPSIVRCSLRST